MFTLHEHEEARAFIYQYMAPTPAIEWPLLWPHVGAETIVKHENCTPTGAFKVRGGLIFVRNLLARRPDVPGIVSASVGNHGLSIAYAGRLFGVPVVIVVPKGTDPGRIELLRSRQAEVVVEGADYEAARQFANQLAEEKGMELVSTWHQDLILGVSTFAAELFDQAGPLDTVYVPVGMGSGISGLIAIRDLLQLDTQIIGVNAAGAPAQKLTFDAGKVVATETVDTIASGVATRQPDAEISEIIKAGAQDIVTVPDAEIASAMRILWNASHHLAEPAGALPLAAAIADTQRRPDRRRVGVILTGSNIDAGAASKILAG